MSGTYQDRVVAEDALKHVFQSDYDHLTASGDSLAGALRLSREKSRELIERLVQGGLVVAEGGAVHLTATGREYALQVLRAHRLYETYLASETGLGSGEWHRRAEVDEHKLTPEHVNALARRLGHPRYDPHGDPIPTSTGELPPARGRALTEWPEGLEARIVHVEDEPATMYSKIVELGLMPGVRLAVEGSGVEGIRVRSEGRSLVLPHAVAANVSVIELEGVAREEAPRRRLTDLGSGEVAEVRGISPAIRGQERNRLLDLGFVPGSPIALEFASPLRSPAAYRVRGSLIALRREQAEQVYIGPSVSKGAVKEENS